MEIKNRLFPYPVLCGDTDDYAQSTEFVIDTHLTETTHELIFNYEYIVNCNALETLIREGKAEYVLHIECNETSLRIALKNSIPHIDYRLPKSRVRGKINIVAMIVARVDINDYSCSDLNDDYLGAPICFKKGSILAYQNIPPIFVIKKLEDLANNESFFTVIKQAGLDPEEIKPLTFNLHNDRIQVLVDEKTYESFVRYQHSKAIALALLVLPALTYMIAEVSIDPESYVQYAWYQHMEKYYQTQGKNFVMDILRKDDNPVSIAQEMLQNPVSKAYRELYVLEG